MSLLVGVAFLVLPLIFPRYAFPLVWGAFFFLLDPCCELLGGPSLIARLHPGRTPGAPLPAGRRAWSAASGGKPGTGSPSAKWVYTLPVLNFGKVFEMPVLGFLGFPPFALECAVMYNFLTVLDERVLTTPTRRRYAWLIQLAFWLVMFAALDAWTVISYQ